ncbi:hypothetical protein GDO86_012202 [Hymenochirus boettgeri]|uniref:Ig-like domain-containing protein n=1 Tax=Hymenochirus boettgeri TaxID=247094 RepID=A0A8T2ILM9_9PIPI|nr:hypothetical protein GDO86_012202 [Hymenochirus boettgeri]
METKRRLKAAGRDGVALDVTSNDTGNFITGKDIILNVNYNTVKSVTVSWTINSTLRAKWIQSSNTSEISSSYTQRLVLFNNGSLRITGTSVTDEVPYTVTVSAIDEMDSSLTFMVKFYDKVESVSINSSVAEVKEGVTPLVNLTCTALKGNGEATWQWTGGPLNITNGFFLLDGNKTLQINQPNKTHAGNYTCTITNPVSSAKGDYTLNVSSKASSSSSLSPGAIAGIVIGSVLGAVLVILIIVLIVWCVRKRKGKENPPGMHHKDVLRTVSGNTLSPDDPAYFTINNIMYRSSSISMGSYIMSSGESLGYNISAPNSPPKLKQATQV